MFYKHSNFPNHKEETHVITSIKVNSKWIKEINIADLFLIVCLKISDEDSKYILHNLYGMAKWVKEERRKQKQVNKM